MERYIKNLLEALRKRKEELEGSMRALSREVKVSRRTLKRWEAKWSGQGGGSLPSEKHLLRLLEHFNIPIPEELKPKPPEESPEIVKTVRKIEHLFALLYLELESFKDGSKELRDIYRKHINLEDTGYLASLITALGEENQFQRWKTFTTARFKGK